MLQNVFGALLLGAGLAAIAGGAWLVHRGRNWHATLDRFDEPTTIDALEPGPVALTGTVRKADDTEPVTGPLSGAEGVVAESRVTTGGGGSVVGSRRRRRILDRQADSTPFVLDDGTGRVRVELPDAPDPLRAALYLLAGLPVLAVALAAAVRGVDRAGGVRFVARSLGSGGAIGLGLLAAGGYLLSRRPPGTLLSAAAWPVPCSRPGRSSSGGPSAPSSTSSTESTCRSAGSYPATSDGRSLRRPLAV